MCALSRFGRCHKRLFHAKRHRSKPFWYYHNVTLCIIFSWLCNIFHVCYSIVYSDFFCFAACQLRVGYFLAPPFWRRLFGAGLLAPSCFGAVPLWRWDVLALGCFGGSQSRQICVLKVGHWKVGQSKQWIKVWKHDKTVFYIVIVS